jgi:putative SOS response-associated peptidase YedK
MCSRYSLTSPAEAVRALFKVSGTEVFPPRYNIAPTQPAHIVRTGTNGERELTLVRWGLIPSWVKDPNTFTTLLNARADTVLEKPSFKNAMKYRRCLVPADGFYEWTGASPNKRPHLIRINGDRINGDSVLNSAPSAPHTQPQQGIKYTVPVYPSLMGFAGLWEHWMSADGSEMESMAIITTDANATVGQIHDRMPVILAPERWDAWLDTREVPAAEAAQMLKPAPDDLLELFEVNKALGNSRNDGPELQRRVEQGQLI